MFTAYINRIEQVYPRLKIKDVQLNEIGQNNDVLIVNNSLVFRFPKYLQGMKRLKDETSILEHVDKLITLPTPVPVYQSFAPFEVRKVFTGYTLIPGKPLWRTEFTKITDESQLDKIASQLVGFLLQLHSISKDQINKILPDQHFNLQEDVLNFYKRIQEKLYPIMGDEAHKDVSSLFEVFFTYSGQFTFEPALIHGDFGASNILYDSGRLEITGIIDFGGSQLGDPAYDFAGILASYGEVFFNRCIALYPNGNEFVKRAHFYKETFALQEALHGIENNDTKAFENGMNDYR